MDGGKQIGVKMTKEPPKGLRANLRATYSKMDDDKLKRTCKPADFRKMLFGKLAKRAAKFSAHTADESSRRILKNWQ